MDSRADTGSANVAQHRPPRFTALGCLGAMSLVAASLAICFFAVARPMSTSDTGPIYTVTELQAHLVRHPNAWVRRTLLVRAVAEPCPAWGSPHDALHCAIWQPDLVDPDSNTLDGPLPLVAAPSDLLSSLLLHLPLARRLLPSLQTPRWGVLATYRIRLDTAPAISCGAATCYQALLLDGDLRRP